MADEKRLYIKTENGIAPIDAEIAKKYSLKSGTKAPFSSGLIVDMDETPEIAEPKTDERIDVVKGELVNDGIAQLDNGMTLSHSEMIDIAEAADSKNS
jgi:hypothetical protein